MSMTRRWRRLSGSSRGTVKCCLFVAMELFSYHLLPAHKPSGAKLGQDEYASRGGSPKKQNTINHIDSFTSVRHYHRPGIAAASTNNSTIKSGVTGKEDQSNRAPCCLLVSE